MLRNPTPIFQKRRGRPRRRPPATPVGPLTLVSATYESGVAVTLTFDRAVDVSGADGTAFTVFDGGEGVLYAGLNPVSLLTPISVRVALEAIDAYPDPGVTMGVTDANGIVPASGGAGWAGAIDVELPYP